MLTPLSNGAVRARRHYDSYQNALPVLEKILLSILLIVVGHLSCALGQVDPQHPNIVIILADDLGYGDVSFNGCPDYQTPNIDSIAANGVLCTSGYATHPFCSPSRAALLTGRYQQRFGHENQPSQSANDPNPEMGTPMQELLLPQILKPAGYVCGAIGKWHIGYTPNLQPTNRGFDEFFGFLGASSNYYNAKLYRNTTPVTEAAYLTDAFTREGVDFINRHATQPFFLYLAYNAVHAPYDTPPATYVDRVANITDPSRRNYAAMVTALDEGIGEVLQTLQSQNLLAKTLIFFLSDNGAPKSSFVRNLPFRGYKYDVLEGGIRVPFAIQWSGTLPQRVVYDHLISTLDIVATAAAAAGVSLPADRVYDGFNIIPYLTNQQPPLERALFWRWFGLGNSGPPGSRDTIDAVRSGPLKLVTDSATVGKPPALYNLVNDVGETQDLASGQPADVDSLKKLYDQWNAETIPPIWLGNGGFNARPLVLAGDWNAFNKNDSRLPWQLTRISAPPARDGTPDAFDWFLNTIHVAASGGDTTAGVHSFSLVGGNSYANQWGGATINIDATTVVPYFSGNTLGPTNSISLEDGFYYSFRILEWGKQVGNSMTLAVMKTSAPPISLSRNSQTPSAPAPGDPVLVSTATSQPKSAEERIYVRWSTDLFVTSHLVQASGSGMNYSATIPGQPARTPVWYCILSSTADLSSLQTGALIDPLVLATSGVFKYITSAASPTPTPTPSVTPTPSPTPSATPASADLKVTVTDGKSAAIAGQKDTYTIVVTNSGPANVSGAAVSDNFPNDFTGVTFTGTQSGGASGFTASGAGNISDTVALPANSHITYKAKGTISSLATGTLSNTATVNAPSGVTDPKLENNSATDTDTLQ